MKTFFPEFFQLNYFGIFCDKFYIIYQCLLAKDKKKVKYLGWSIKVIKQQEDYFRIEYFRMSRDFFFLIKNRKKFQVLTQLN